MEWRAAARNVRFGEPSTHSVRQVDSSGLLRNLPKRQKASDEEAPTVVGQRGTGRNRTDEWRFCSSTRVLANLQNLSEATTLTGLYLGRAPRVLSCQWRRGSRGLSSDELERGSRVEPLLSSLIGPLGRRPCAALDANVLTSEVMACSEPAPPASVGLIPRPG